ncbi:hypothetical protein XMM379_002269 [Aliiroseovarius sp. xm-m-379]|nr:hypothetical protein [Aliiroseovarius sp. xm-m-379]NRP29564.1 hypothetical protein [Aliiroseovarius sp. xm-m-314]NRP34370.1 hypothetical protein [Aliiroseovarius sp. xm-a-104]NRP44302.1 hypothetical protein [Aliiroseovarius sp. xm-m-378]NRP65173.1 hypothetical protein [Aliiroseovarius sp. xm-v-225]NRP79206.1 hypothetical protein [Aliiroseovarius sp. xm-v-209]NRQ10327.1 hypothetical protein [Aliiroseovarius sp. xm-v-208]NRQ21492.1 hypothetical protein [Aliiroseovarius sp. xm-v-204]NRQ2665
MRFLGRKVDPPILPVGSILRASIADASIPLTKDAADHVDQHIFNHIPQIGAFL